MVKYSDTRSCREEEAMSSDLMIVAEFLEGFKWYFKAPSKKSYGLFF